MRPGRDRGIALLVVLWAGVILMLVALGISDRARTDLLLTRNLTGATEAELAADAGAWLAVARVWTGSPEPMLADGTIYSARIGGADVRFRASDESQRIDLNFADEATLTGLFEAAGLETDASRVLVDAIVARREIAFNERKRTERIVYPFTSTDELTGVGTLDAAMLRRLESSITVYTGEPLPGSNGTPGLAVSRLEGAAADRMEGNGEAAPSSERGRVSDAAQGAGMPRSPPTILRVEAEGRSDGGAIFMREAVIVRGRSGRDGAPFAIRMWRRGRSGTFDEG